MAGPPGIGGSPPPLMGFRGTPRTRTRRTRTGMGFRPTRAAFLRPAGVRPTSRSTDRSRPRPSLRFSAPSETCLLSPAPRPRARCFLSWAFVPYDTCWSVTQLLDSGSPRRRAPRPRFGYLRRDLSSPSSRRRSAGASMGFALQGLLLVRKRYPSRGPCPPDVTRAA
jgi:hypothetical protein